MGVGGKGVWGSDRCSEQDQVNGYGFCFNITPLQHAVAASWTLHVKCTNMQLFIITLTNQRAIIILRHVSATEAPASVAQAYPKKQPAARSLFVSKQISTEQEQSFLPILLDLHLLLAGRSTSSGLWPSRVCMTRCPAARQADSTRLGRVGT